MFRTSLVTPVGEGILDQSLKFPSLRASSVIEAQIFPNSFPFYLKSCTLRAIMRKSLLNLIFWMLASPAGAAPSEILDYLKRSPSYSTNPLFGAFVSAHENPLKLRNYEFTPEDLQANVLSLVIFYETALDTFDLATPTNPFQEQLKNLDSAWATLIQDPTERRELLAVLLSFAAHDFITRDRFAEASRGLIKPSVSASLTKYRDRIWIGKQIHPAIEFWHLGISPDWSPQTSRRLLALFKSSNASSALEAKLQKEWLWPETLPPEAKDRAIQRFLNHTLSSHPQGFVDQMQSFFKKRRSSDEDLLKAVLNSLRHLTIKWLETLPGELAAQKQAEEAALLKQLESLEHLRGLLESAFTQTYDPYYLTGLYGRDAVNRILKAVEDGRIENPAKFFSTSEPHAWLLYVVQNYLKDPKLPVSILLSQADRAKVLAIRVKVKKEPPQILTPYPKNRCQDALRRF